MVVAGQESESSTTEGSFLGVQGPVSVAASAKLGKVIDLAWVPLPAPVGGGSVIVVAGEDGSLAVVDATQTVEYRSLKRRLAAFKNLVGGRWPFPQVPSRLCETVSAFSCIGACMPFGMRGPPLVAVPDSRLCMRIRD